jgi:cytosine/adenosine deaminase-related metal-dependent hydrolase
MRLASGIAKIPAMWQAGVPVGLGVDGSASNDGGHLLAEARLAMLLQRVAPHRYLSEAPGGRGGFGGKPDAMTAREALRLATRGGAEVLGRDDIGYLAPGMSADFIAVNLNQVAFAGSLHDPVAAMLFCQPPGVDYSVINGKIVVENGRLTTIDLPVILERHNRIAIEMMNGE